MPVKNFIQIEAANDWGYVYYAYAGKALTNGFARRANGFSLKEGTSVKVEWPSGKITTEKLVRKPYTTTVERSEVNTARWGIEAFLYGVKVFVDLCELKVEEGSL